MQADFGFEKRLLNTIAVGLNEMIEREPSLETKKQEQSDRLQNLLNEYSDRRVMVMGTTCTGKTTFLENITGASDMDKLLFPQLTSDESDFVNQTPWTPEIGEVMTRLTKERVNVEVGKPVFGTVLLDADLVIYLAISDDLLKERTGLRNSSFDGAKNMQQQIEAEIAESGLPVIEYNVG